jgi:soluble lytic murein transglycosylase-like protein
VVRFNIAAACVAAALLSTSAASARPKRTALLLDFSGPQAPAPVADQGPEASLDVGALSRLMTRQFTGASDDAAMMTMPFQPSMPRPPNNLLALGNPFVRHAAYEPIYSPAVAGPNAGECLMADYRPSVGFSRGAEERRRVIFPLVHRAACAAGLPVGLFDALIMQESRYSPSAVSPKGAIGLAQLMPDTARQLGVNRYSLFENLLGGARFLKEHIDRFGRYDLALAAYNAGPNRQSLREGRIPNISETQGYVRTILSNWSGTPLATLSPAKPLNFRQAQLIFMAYRSGDN